MLIYLIPVLVYCHIALLGMDMDERKRILGQAIRAKREDQGITLRRFALMIGLGHTYLIDVEKGRRNIGIENLCKIADGLGIDVSDLTKGL